MALTNRVDVAFSYENIMRDFDIFIVTKESQKLDRTDILDVLQDRFQALSVLYTYGRNAFALFTKGSVAMDDFRNAFVDAYKDVTVRKVKLEDLLDKKFCEEYLYYKNRMLAQLLINSIRVPRNKQFSYNNLTGKLYYGCSDWIVRRSEPPKDVWKVSFLQVSFDKGMYLNLDVKTFTKQNPGYGTSKRKYVFDEKTKVFRKMLDSDSNREFFIEAAVKGRRQTVPYLNINNFSSFSKCKLGILYRFLEDVKDYLGDYMTITLLSRDDLQMFETTKKLKKGVSESFMGQILNRKGVNIVDLVDSPASRELVGFLVEILLKTFGVSPTVGALCASAYNIRIIHDDDYYEANQIGDPHDDDLGDCIVQHVTVESMDKVNYSPKSKKKDISEEERIELQLKDREKHMGNICNKLVHELILKNDVRQCMISIYDWERLSFNKTWSFVIRESIQENKPNKGENTSDNKKESSSAEKKPNERVQKKYRYYMVQIAPDGSMQFSNFGEDNPELCPVFQELANDMRNYGSVDGFVFTDIDNIHIIVESKEKTMPNISAVWNNLQETDDRDQVDRDVLIDAVTSLAQDEPEYFQEYAKDVVTQLMAYDPFIKKKALRGILKINHDLRKKYGVKLNRLLHEQRNIWIFSEIRSSDFEDVYRISDIAGIQHFEDTDDNGTYFFNYFVGPKRSGMDCSVHNASVIRKIYTGDESVEFRELLPLMDVEFVRNGLSTVVPFPFKYLREYKIMCKAAKEKSNREGSVST